MTWLESIVRVETFSGTGLLSSLFISISLTFALFYFFKRQQKVWLIDKIPGPKAFPIFGNSLEMIVEPNEIFLRFDGYVKIWGYGYSFIKSWIAHRPCVVLFKPEEVKTILSSQKYIDKSKDYTYLRPWLGTGLLTSTGHKWHHRRKMLTPTFHVKILEDFTDVFNHQSSIFVKNLEPKSDGKPFDILQYIILCTLDIILETAMGRSINAQENSQSEYVKAVHKMASIIQLRQTRLWLQPDFLFKLSEYGREHERSLQILHKFSRETIKERREKYAELKKMKELKNKDKEELMGKRKRLAFLDLLLESSNESNFLSDENIREEVDTFMFEGHDTTAAAINWSIYLLGSHPEIQEKVLEEMNTIFGDSDRPATMTDLCEMKFLECCIKEALRIFPSVPFIGRELQEDVFIDGFRVPTGTTILIMIYRLHRDPVQFPDPELFKPERFLPENSARRHPYAFVPFSAGPRNCIGQKFALMEEKVVLSSFFRKYRVESTIRREDMKLVGQLILRPEDGNTVKLFPRK